jgi:pentatricopeptide repeat protein
MSGFNFLLDALGRVKLAKEAQMLFERMRERFPPNVKLIPYFYPDGARQRI